MELGASISSAGASSVRRMQRDLRGFTSVHSTTSAAAAGPRTSSGASSRWSTGNVLENRTPEEPIEEPTTLDDERQFLHQRFEKLRSDHPGFGGADRKQFAVAFSGGGVRAAAYHCGLLWALSAENLMKDVSHLAVVSGGAYTAACYVTHLLKASDETPPQLGSQVDTWYKEVVARTILRMQHNINYLVRIGTRCRADQEWERGRGCCPRIFDIPFFILTIIATACISPALIFINTVWPLVLCIEHELAATLRSAWCDPMHTPYSEALLQWSKTRLIYFAGLTASLGVLLALLARLGCCRPNREHYVSHLFRRSMQQVLIRGAICYSIYVTVPWILLQMQNLSWGTQSVLFKTEKGKEWVHYYCWKYIHESIRNGPSCIDYMQPFHNTLWFNDGHNSLYRNATWLAENHVGLRPTGQDPGGDTQYTTPMFLVVNLIIFAAGLIGLLWGLSLLRWYLTLAGPIWAAFLVALVAQWQIFGPLTGQYLFPNLLHFSEKSSSWIFRVCIIAAVITLPIYDLLIKLIHSYYRRSLQLAYFCDGEDIEFPAAAESPYCPNLLLGACINDFRRPEDKELLSDFTLSPLFMGCPRTGFFRTDRRMRLGYAISVSGAAPDTLMLTKFDVLPIRFLLSVFSLRLGDFVRLAPDGKVAKQMGTAFRRIEERAAPSAAGNEVRAATAQFLVQRVWDGAPVALIFVACHLFVMLGRSLDTAGSCGAYHVVLQMGLSGFVIVLLLSFFAFAPQLRWLMRSPLILQFQMMFMHRHQAIRPPPYVYVSDGGLIECLGVLMLLRRRMPLIICSDACEDMNVTLRALLDTIHLARQEKLCSFFDVNDPRRDVQLSMAEVRHSRCPYLRLGIRYEPTGNSEAMEGELLYIRMRLAPNDAAPERGLLEKSELMEEPTLPHGSTFDTGVASSRATESDMPPRREMNGLWCSGPCARRCPGRRFPDFGTGNQFLQPRHFANLCALGAEMALPAAKYISRSLRSSDP